MRETSLVADHNVDDNVLVLVVTFTGVEEPSNSFRSDIEASSSSRVCSNTWIVNEIDLLT